MNLLQKQNCTLSMLSPAPDGRERDLGRWWWREVLVNSTLNVR